MRIEGCLSAIPTPFTQSGIDERTLAEHAAWMVDKGCAGIVVCGTTGESATMTDDEKIRAMNIVSEAVGDHAIVVGGAGNNCTQESLDFCERVNRETRVHAIMSVVPYYTKPPQEGVRAHFRAIADVSKTPVIIYNVPSRSVVSMTVDTMLSLLDHPNIVSIKEASGDIHIAGLLARSLDGRGTLLSGDDGTSMAFMAVGGHGVVSVASNVAPQVMSSMCQALAAGDLATARVYNDVAVQLQDLLFQMPSPIPTKVVLEKLGFGSAHVRLPLVGMPEGAVKLLHGEVERLGLSR